VSGCGRWSRDVDDDADACDASLNPDHSELFQGPVHVMFVNGESQALSPVSRTRKLGYTRGVYANVFAVDTLYILYTIYSFLAI
jgi:hypothetical protein